MNSEKQEQEALVVLYTNTRLQEDERVALLLENDGVELTIHGINLPDLCKSKFLSVAWIFLNSFWWTGKNELSRIVWQQMCSVYDTHKMALHSAFKIARWIWRWILDLATLGSIDTAK